MSHIPFSAIQNHDNTEQARIYPAKLKDIVPGRQSGIISGLNKCKILTGTNASNGSRTRGYIFPLCSPSLVGMYLCPPPPLARPPRTTWEAGPPPLSCPAIMHLAEVDEGRYQYQIEKERKTMDRQELTYNEENCCIIFPCLSFFLLLFGNNLTEENLTKCYI